MDKRNFIVVNTVNVFGNVIEIMVLNEGHVLVSRTKIKSSIMLSSIDTILNLWILFKFIPNGNDYVYFNQNSNITISNSNDATRIRIRILESDMKNVILQIDIAERTLNNIPIYCYYNTFIGNESTDVCTIDNRISNFQITIKIILLTQLINVVFINTTKYSNTFAIITVIFTIIIIYWSYVKNKTLIHQNKLWLQLPNDKLIQINCCEIDSILVNFDTCCYCIYYGLIKLKGCSQQKV